MRAVLFLLPGKTGRASGAARVFIFLKEGSMLKKSLLLSIVVLLTAVLFVFTGCEGPTGAQGVGVKGDPGDDTPFPGEIQVTFPPAEEELPQGVNYPDGRAKILAGDAEAISKAFNGGVFVSSTGDGVAVSGNGFTGENSYKQEAVDAIVWTGYPTGAAANRGAIVVPPGKTLFIAAPLDLTADVANGFSSIAVSDQGVYPNPSGSAESSVLLVQVPGGSPITDVAKGRVVILAGASITANGSAPGTMTVGGALEIHRGGLVNVSGSGAAFNAVPDSVVDVFGSLVIGSGNLGSGTSANQFNGVLNVWGRGAVNIAAGAGITFGDAVTVARGATYPFTLPGQDVTFNGDLTVGEGVNLSVGSSLTYTFNGNADLSGNITITTGGDVEVGSTGSLVIEETGDIIGDWNAVDTGTIATLKAALAAQKADVLGKGGIAILSRESSGTTNLNLDITLDAIDYPELVTLAADENWHLRSISYPYSFPTGAALLRITAGNNVDLTSAVTIGKVTKEAGGYLTLGGSVTTADELTIIGTPAAGITVTDVLDTFNKLTIGDSAGTRTVVNVSSAAITLAGTTDTSEITVHPNAELNFVNDVIPSLNPKGTIKLMAGITGGSSTLDGGKFATVATSLFSSGSATFADLKILEIGANKAEFSLPASGTTYGHLVTFAGLEKLTVNGRLVVESPALSFAELNTNIGATTDVAGTGEAVFPNLDIDANIRYAFDQLLAIKDLTVASLDVPATSGFHATVDAGDQASDAIIRAATIAITTPASLTIDRNLEIGTSLTFTGTKNVTIKGNNGATPNPTAKATYIYIGEDPVIGVASGGEVLLVPGAASTLAPGGTGTLNTGVAGITVEKGTLLVPGKLGAVTAITAGKGANTAVLAAGASLTSGSIEIATVDPTNSSAAITVNADGVLDAAASTSYVLPKSSIAVKDGGKITVGSGGSLQLGAASSKVNIGASSGLTSASDSSITVTDATHIALAGTFKAVGANALVGVAANEVDLGTSAKLIAEVGTDTSYVHNKIELTGGTFDGFFTLNGTTANISLTGTLTAGSLLTTGTSVLTIGTYGTLATGTTAQTLGTATLNGVSSTGGLTAGTLQLVSGAKLTVNAAFNVGNAGASTASTAILNVGSGTIAFSGPYSIVLAKSGGTAVNGALTTTAFTVAGQGTGTLVNIFGVGTGAADCYPSGATIDATTLGANDILVSGTNNSAHDADGTGCMSVGVASGVITISGGLTNTIIPATKLGLKE
jgi:hypothetical protein